MPLPLAANKGEKQPRTPCEGTFLYRDARQYISTVSDEKILSLSHTHNTPPFVVVSITSHMQTGCIYYVLYYTIQKGNGSVMMMLGF